MKKVSSDKEQQGVSHSCTLWGSGPCLFNEVQKTVKSVVVQLTVNTARKLTGVRIRNTQKHIAL